MAARMEVLSFEAQDATHFGQIRAEQAAKGKPIGPFGTMIAAHARTRGLILVINSRKEFFRVAGLRLDNRVE